jgi:hypothetical protein
MVEYALTLLLSSLWYNQHKEEASQLEGMRR